jgi:hypothetical protein
MSALHSFNIFLRFIVLLVGKLFERKEKKIREIKRKIANMKHVYTYNYVTYNYK